MGLLGLGVLECVTDEKIAMQCNTGVIKLMYVSRTKMMLFKLYIFVIVYSLVVESVYFSILVRCVCVLVVDEKRVSNTPSV